MPDASSRRIPRLLVTMGDPAGIGPEVTATALAGEAETTADYTIIGMSSCFPETLPIAWQPADAWEGRFADSARPGIRGLALSHDASAIPIGQPSAASGRASLAALTLACDILAAGKADGLVTAPIAKNAWQMAGATHTGHTTFLADRFGRDVTMAFAGGELFVGLATIHLPLMAVAERLAEPGLLERTIRQTAEGAARLRCKPLEAVRVGVVGLNPHAGEDGMFGDEESQLIVPAMDRVRQEGLQLLGPLPPDTAFHRARHGEFDGLVAMYHDQALCAVKTLDFHGTVNTTLGLPFPRTSPDHGTAFDIAGQSKAHPGSMRAAIALAARLCGTEV